MTDWENSRKILYPLGVTLEKDGAVIMAQAEGENAALLLYEAGGKTPCERIPFLQETVWETYGSFAWKTGISGIWNIRSRWTGG